MDSGPGPFPCRRPPIGAPWGLSSQDGQGRWIVRNPLPLVDIENEGERQLESGTPLPLENEFPTADGLIFKLFDVLLDQSFFTIEPNEKAYRCKKIPYNQNKIETKIITNNSIITESEVIFEEVPAAPSVNEVESIVIKKVKDEIIIQKSEYPVLEKQPTKKWWEFWK